MERFAFDARWKYAAGGLDFDYPGFVHTVLVDMRARLARSDRPNRIFEVTLEAAKAAGLVGRKRVLDSTPLYDAVATMDTVTLVRSAIRGLLKVADAELAAELRAVLARDDDYAARANRCVTTTMRPRARRWWTRWPATRRRCWQRSTGASWPPRSTRPPRCWPPWSARTSTATTDGVFRIARRVATDRVISTVDPRRGTGARPRAHGFDGYKGHLAIDPDSRDRDRHRGDRGQRR